MFCQLTADAIILVVVYCRTNSVHQITVLTLLDLSAAFDTVHHSTPLRRLRTSYAFGDSVFIRLASYLDHRMQHVCWSSNFRVQQGSVLGPILFLLHTADLQQLVELYNMCPHLYTDDTLINEFCQPGTTAQLQGVWLHALPMVRSLCGYAVALSNRLKLNTAKTEVLWCCARRLHQMPTVPLTVRSNDVTPVSTIRDLSIYTDWDISMRHISLKQFELFCCTATDPCHQALHFKTCPAVTGCVNGVDTTGLRESDFWPVFWVVRWTDFSRSWRRQHSYFIFYLIIQEIFNKNSDKQLWSKRCTLCGYHRV